jgi:hypothetical protein
MHAKERSEKRVSSHLCTKNRSNFKRYIYNNNNNNNCSYFIDERRVTKEKKKAILDLKLFKSVKAAWTNANVVQYCSFLKAFSTYKTHPKNALKKYKNSFHFYIIS